MSALVAGALRYRVPLPPACVAFASVEGRALFRAALEAGTAASYFRLAEQFATQAEPSFCGLTTLVVCLNALSVDPGRGWKGVWRWFSEDMLECCVSLDTVRTMGITLDAFVCTARCNGATVSVHRPSDHGLDEFRRAVQRVSRTPEGVVLVAAYSRAGLGQTGSGHFSPLAAYDATSDSVLVLDVARFKYPPHWVSLPVLYDAMKALDPDTGRSRGYALLRRDVVSPLLAFRLTDPTVVCSPCDPSIASGTLGVGAARLLKAIDSAITRCACLTSTTTDTCCAASSDVPSALSMQTSALDEAIACFVDCYFDFKCVAGIPLVRPIVQTLNCTSSLLSGCDRSPSVQHLSPEHAQGVSTIIHALEQLNLYPSVVAAVQRSQSKSGDRSTVAMEGANMEPHKPTLDSAEAIGALYTHEAHAALMMLLVWGMLPERVCEHAPASTLLEPGAVVVLRSAVHRALPRMPVEAETSESTLLCTDMHSSSSSSGPSLLAAEVQALVQQMSVLLTSATGTALANMTPSHQTSS